MRSIRVETAPAIEPVTLDEAKLHLRVDHALEDDLISALITVAREQCETWQRRALITQTLELVMDNFPYGAIELPMPKLQSVTSIKYTDEDGVEATFSSANYYVATASEPGRIVLRNNASWPTGIELQEAEGVVIQYVCGYGDEASDVPQMTRQGILMMIGHLYENREMVVIDRGISVMEVPHTVAALWWPHRVFGL